LCPNYGDAYKTPRWPLWDIHPKFNGIKVEVEAFCGPNFDGIGNNKLKK